MSTFPNDLRSFFILRSITKKGHWLANAYQLLLFITLNIRVVRLWYSHSIEKHLLQCIGHLALTVFHLMHMKTKAGPVELEPLLFEEANRPPVPPLDDHKKYNLDQKILGQSLESFNSAYGTEMTKEEFGVMKKVWTDRYDVNFQFMWHSGKCDWAWYNRKAQLIMQAVPLILAYNLSRETLYGLLEMKTFEPLSFLMDGVELMTECLCMVGTWLFLMQITLELMLVLHIEGIQLKRHLARILVGDLKTLEEIFKDHLVIKLCTMSSWAFYQLPMLYAAFMSFVAMVACSFYIYTEGPLDSTGYYPNKFLRWAIYIVLIWGSILMAVANTNLVSDQLVLQIPLVPTLKFAERQELVRYYQLNKAYFYLLPMGIVVTPLVVLGWLLSLTTMGVFSVLNQVYFLAQQRVGVAPGP